MVTVQDLRYHLGIDYADDMVTVNLTRALASAEARMHGAVGSDVSTYLPDDPRIDQLVLLYAAENYDERGASAKQASVQSRIAHDLELQLRLELRAAKEAAGGAS